MVELSKEVKAYFVKYSEAEAINDKTNMMRYLRHIINLFTISSAGELFIEYLGRLQVWYHENFV